MWAALPARSASAPTAPSWDAPARRYVDQHFGGAGTSRQYSLLGDAELGEGACREAIVDPTIAELGEVVWIMDLNRQQPVLWNVYYVTHDQGPRSQRSF